MHSGASLFSFLVRIKGHLPFDVLSLVAMEDPGADVKNLHSLCLLAPAEKQMMLKHIVHCGKLSILQVIGVAFKSLSSQP